MLDRIVFFGHEIKALRDTCTVHSTFMLYSLLKKPSRHLRWSPIWKLSSWQNNQPDHLLSTQTPLGPEFCFSIPNIVVLRSNVTSNCFAKTHFQHQYNLSDWQPFCFSTVALQTKVHFWELSSYCLWSTLWMCDFSVKVSNSIT